MFWKPELGNGLDREGEPKSEVATDLIQAWRHKSIRRVYNHVI